MLLLGNERWRVLKTKNKGRGLFAKKDIPAGIVIGDYIGKVLRTQDVEINDNQNLYLMYYHDYASIYPNLKKPGVHLINHSCTPNCWIYTYQGHTLFFALRHIFKSEELTISYLLSPKDQFCKPCTHVCKCKSSLCTKSMHLSHEKYKKWRRFQSSQAKKTKRKRIRYNKDLPALPSYPKIIPDHPIYSLYGNSKLSPASFADKILPPIGQLRTLIRKTGRVLVFPYLKIKIHGIENNLLISE